MSPKLHQSLRARADDRGVVAFREFMRCALFEPGCGYYSSDRVRVGRSRTSDFYTATSLGPVFGRLVAACAATLARRGGFEPAAMTFVELGVEPAGGVLRGVEHGFRCVEELALDPARPLAERLSQLSARGPLVVFSNELFDAQPVRRWVRREDAWSEAGVALGERAEAPLSWAHLAVEPAAYLADPILEQAGPGWTVDAPEDAVLLATELAAVPWTGVFIAFDYGLPWTVLSRERPEGTLRGYRNHTLVTDLLSEPGETDLTAHVCWDWLEGALSRANCSEVRVEAQESFLVRGAPEALARLSAEAARTPLGPVSRTLQELLHPARMGRKFQVLSALRRAVA